MSEPIPNNSEPISPAEPIPPVELVPSAELVPPVELVPPAEPIPPAEELLSETGALIQEPVVQEAPVVQQEPVNEKITLTTDKSVLTNLAQTLNANLLVNVAAYKAILLKIKDNTSNVEKQKPLEENIKELEMVENSVTNLLVSVQTNLEVESDKMINASGVLEEAGSSNNFVQKILNTEAIAILAAMLAPIGLGGGSKHKGKKKTRRQKNKGNKTTKRASKI